MFDSLGFTTRIYRMQPSCLMARWLPMCHLGFCPSLQRSTELKGGGEHWSRCRIGTCWRGTIICAGGIHFMQRHWDQHREVHRFLKVSSISLHCEWSVSQLFWLQFQPQFQLQPQPQLQNRSHLQPQLQAQSRHGQWQDLPDTANASTVAALPSR